MLVFKTLGDLLQFLAQAIILPPAATTREVAGHRPRHAETHRGIGKKFLHFLAEVVETILALHPPQERHESRERRRALHLGKNFADRGAQALGLRIGRLAALALERRGLFGLVKKPRGVIEIQPRLGGILAAGGDFSALISAHHIVQRGLHRIRHHIDGGGLETGDRGRHEQAVN